MALVASQLGSEVLDLIREAGRPIRVTTFAESGATTGYDDDVVFISGTDTWTSGLVMPIDANRGSSEAILIEQGRLLSNDLICYVLGEIQTSGAGVRIGLGSPPTESYYIIPEGVTAWEIGGTKVYKKVYLRDLTLGSFYLWE